MKLICFVGGVLFSLTCISQKSIFDIHKKYTVNQILEDIDYTEKYLTKFHPDPYKYISKDSLHAFVLSLKSKVDTSLTEMQARFYIKQLVAKIGCGHTDAAASKNYTKTIRNINRPILPLNVVITDSNKIFILNNFSSDTSLKTGDEIISIDNHSTASVLKTIYSIYTTDGYNTTLKKQGIRYDWFKYYYSFCYGFHQNYTVTVKRENSNFISTQLAAVGSFKDTLILPKKDSVNYIYKTKKCKYSVVKQPKPIAVIDIDGFSGRQWRKFFRKTFKDIDRKNIENLVVDLRDNGGGKINAGLYALSYMIPKKLTLPFDRKPNLMLFNPRFKMGLGTRVTPLLFCTSMLQFPIKGRLQHYFISLPKYRNRFKGNIYVLINGKSFSMSCIAATYLKYKAHATIIGEETGGNISGSNAIISGKIILPNSHIRVYIPMYHIYHNIEVTNTAHGLMPDFPTHYTKEDLLNTRDLDLKKVLELVK